MQAPSGLRKHLILGLLALGCMVLDTVALIALGSAVKWLIRVSSPFILAGFAATVLVAFRIFLSMRLLNIGRFPLKPTAPFENEIRHEG